MPGQNDFATHFNGHIPDIYSTPAPISLSRRAALLGVTGLLSLRGRAADAEAIDATGTSRIVRLDSNENPYGPSPAARRAILASVVDAPRYEDELTSQVSDVIAAHMNMRPDEVVIGSGSSELINMAALLGAQQGIGGELVTALPTYELAADFGRKVGLTTVSVPLDEQHRINLPAMLDALTPRTKVIYVCNPNNPTGTALPRASVESFIRSVPASILIVVDEAYMDFVESESVGTIRSLVPERNNLIVLGTFSKLHGIAGLRVGYGIAAPELAERLRSIQLTYPNVTGRRAAIASIGDKRFLVQARRMLLSTRSRIEAVLDKLGRPRTQSVCNFVFFDTGLPWAQFAGSMRAAGIIVARHFQGYDTWARVAVTSNREADRFLGALPKALREA